MSAYNRFQPPVAKKLSGKFLKALEADLDQFSGYPVTEPEYHRMIQVIGALLGHIKYKDEKYKKAKQN